MARAPSADLADWPADLGAPVVDGDGTPGNYDLVGGDRPDVRGESTAFWLMNDAGSEHATTGGAPLGVEVGVTAFAQGTDTYYRIGVTNRSDRPIDSLRVGFYADADLGGATDDYMGSDSLLHLGYVYNADDFDEGQRGYGAAPPAIGVQMLSGADAVTDFRLGVMPPGATDSCFFGGGQYELNFFNLLGGQSCVGVPFSYGGTGVDYAGPPTRYLFTGDPETGTGWTEGSVSSEPDDRRLIVASAPEMLSAGGSRTVDVALLYARGADHLASVTALKGRAEEALAIYAQGDLFPVGAEEGAPLPAALSLSAYPNPSAGTVTLAYRLAASEAARLVVYDALGREVARLSGAATTADTQRIRLDGSGLPAGLYVAVLEAGPRREAVRFSIVR